MSAGPYGLRRYNACHNCGDRDNLYQINLFIPYYIRLIFNTMQRKG